MLSIDAKSVLGVFADFVQANRAVLLNGGMLNATVGSSAKAEHGSRGVALSGAGALTAAGEIGVPRGVVLSGAGALTAAGEIVTRIVSLLLQTVIVPGEQTDEGRLIEAVALP
jgi:hypothetical protein